MPNIASRLRRIHKSTSEIAQSTYTDKLITNVVVKKLRFETLKILNIPNISREIIPGVVHTVQKFLLENTGIALILDNCTR